MQCATTQFEEHNFEDQEMGLSMLQSQQTSYDEWPWHNGKRKPCSPLCQGSSLLNIAAKSPRLHTLHSMHAGFELGLEHYALARLQVHVHDGVLAKLRAVLAHGRVKRLQRAILRGLGHRAHRVHLRPYKGLQSNALIEKY